MIKKILHIFSLLLGFSAAMQAQALPIDVTVIPPTSVKAGQKLYPTESINGKQTWRAITVEQIKDYVVQSAGFEKTVSVEASLPQLPTPTKIHYDHVSKAMYYYKTIGNAWFYQGDLVRAASPSDTQYLVSGQMVTIKYTDAKWFNTASNSWWDYDYSQNVWRNRTQWTIDDLLGRNNTWTGKNTFEDSLPRRRKLLRRGSRKLLRCSLTTKQASRRKRRFVAVRRVRIVRRPRRSWSIPLPA